MDRCGCDDYASPIYERDARDDRESYHAAGPDETTRMLLDLIEAEGVDDATILDVGGGIGVIDHELIRGGARSATIVEASPPYLDAAREEAGQAGLLDRIAIIDGDFVRLVDDIEAADIVTLDRVICCYPDADALVSASAGRAKRVYGLVLPRDRWYVRWAMRLENFTRWLRRDAYRAFAHPNTRIDAQLQTSGLPIRSEAQTHWWRIVLYVRDAPLESEASGVATG